MCEHRFLDHPDGLPCTRADVHTTGHTYQASDAPDRHTNEVNDD
jgi:hypothetical protein